LYQCLLCNHRLQPRHTSECWRGLCPRPLPLIDRLTGPWNPWTLTTLHGVVGWCHVPSTVGLALTGLHWPKGLHHRAFRGRRREERKMKTMIARSRWSPASLGHRRYARLLGSPSVQGADPMDRWHHRPPPRYQACRPLPSPRQDRRRCFLQARPALCLVCAATRFSVGSPTLPPHPAKAEHPSCGTRRPSQAGERAEKEGERRRRTRASGDVSAPEEVSGWKS
jgi:hypothetical protein